MAAHRALIVGGSMGGLAAACALRQIGWQVKVLEQSTQALSARGAGIVTHQGLRLALQRLGLSVQGGLGLSVPKRAFVSPSGQTLARSEWPQEQTSWQQLWQRLRQAVPDTCYVLGASVHRVDPGGTDALAHATWQAGQGQPLTGEDADLVVLANGLRSPWRAAWFDAPAPSYAGYVAWRALVPLAELSPPAQAMFGQTFVFSQAPGEQILAYPVQGQQQRTYINLVWYRATNEATRDAMLTDAQGVRHAHGMAPHRLLPKWPEAAIEAAAGLWHPVWAEALQRAPQLLLQVIADATTPRMSHARVALLGDAAFVARPHVGQGVTKAVGDALALAEALQHEPNVSQALMHYSRTRVAVGQRAVQQGQRLGAVVAHQGQDMARWAQHYAQPRHLLADTAVEIPGVAHVGAASLHV
jgi:2-polyprenyl-6-methoxyphenol hydroxylase-like FAD-dependent oxidoreductase